MKAAASANQRLGDQAWMRMTKIVRIFDECDSLKNAELFLLTYGAFVMQLVRDYESVSAVNEQLERIGYNIGTRLIDELLAKANVASCSDFRDTSEVIAKVGFKMYLGITAEVVSWNAAGTAFSLILHENPLTEFVELPPQFSTLEYSNVLCGVIRGALEMVQKRVTCRFVKDMIRGDDVTEIRVELQEIIRETMDDEYKEY